MKVSTIVILIILGFIPSLNSQTPNSFLNIKLGTQLSVLLNNNPNLYQRALFYVNTYNININGLERYIVNKTTSSGDDVRMVCYFYQDKLAVIRVDYLEYQPSLSILEALKSKFGHYNNLTTEQVEYQGGLYYREIDVAYWEKGNYLLTFIHNRISNKSLAEYLNIKKTDNVVLVFADKLVQEKMEKDKSIENLKKIE